MKLLKNLVIGVLAVTALHVSAESLEDRIKPAGSLCMAGDACASAATVQVASADGAAAAVRSGKEVYDTKCATCHATGAAGAPKMGDDAAWALRLAKTMDVLYVNAIKGINAMPAKGLCFDCSDEEIKASVDHMIGTSK